MSTARELVLVCPACRAALPSSSEPLVCAGCGREYPVIAGILDLRLHDDRYLTLEEDREKARALDAVDGAFEDVVRAYWARTPEVPAPLAERFVAAVLDGERRAAGYLDDLRQPLGALLDVGCGTGGLLVEAASRGAQVAGVDIALRWLVVARSRLEDRGVDAVLVAADGGVLPFHNEVFDTVVSLETLEHAADARGVLHGCLAAARSDGQVLVVTANRWSLAREPTVRLWGVGFLPRRVAARYVRWRRHTGYEYVQPVSPSEVEAFLGPDHPGTVSAGPLPRPPEGARWARRRAQRAYDRVRARPALGRLLRWVAPYLQIRRG